MKTLCVVVKELGQFYSTFIPLLSKPIAKNKIQYPEYDKLLAKINKQQTLGNQIKIKSKINQKSDQSNQSKTNNQSIKINQNQSKSIKISSNQFKSIKSIKEEIKVNPPKHNFQ